MVDFLKRSLENLEPPTCPHCHIDMKWYRSFRTADVEDSAMIAHFFQCPSCHRVSETKTKLDKKDLPPSGKLSRPHRRSSSAAA